MLFGLRKNEDEIVALIKANKKNWKKISGSFVSLFFVAIGVFFLISSHASSATTASRGSVYSLWPEFLPTYTAWQ
jgi:hypothetical protein